MDSGAKCQKYREIVEKNGEINKKKKHGSYTKKEEREREVKPRNLFPVKREQCGLSLVDISGSRAFSLWQSLPMFEKFRTRANPKLSYVRILYDEEGGEKKKKKRRYDLKDTEREAKVSTRIE